MKNLLLLLVVLLASLYTQSQVISSVQINLPANPDANTANWKTGTSLLTITATARMVNGRVEPQVEECRMLVVIKKNGARVCGSYQPSSAPLVSFNTAVKVWTGAGAVALLGQDCELTPGDYECSVQFFNRQGNAGLSAEKTKPFTIPAPSAIHYQLPQPISPANGAAIAELRTPVTFRWTPVFPRPTEPVTYRVRVWQLMQGQNSMQAANSAQPIYTKEVNNITQLMAVNILTGPCKPPYLCEFVWNVQAIGRDGKPVGENNGTGETWKWKLAPEQSKTEQVKLLSPANGSVVTDTKNIRFSWQTDDPDNAASYKIKIVEIKGDESPENALRTNKPIFEKDSFPPSFKGNKPFFEKDSAKLFKGNKPIFEKDSVNALKTKIVEIKGDESPDNALRTNKPIFEKDSFPPSFKGNKPIFEKDSISALRGNKPFFEKDSAKLFKGNKPIFEKDSISALRGNKPFFEKDSISALKGNKPFFEKDSISAMKGNKPIFEKDSIALNLPDGISFQPGKRYAWQVEILDKDNKVSASSAVGVFSIEPRADKKRTTGISTGSTILTTAGFPTYYTAKRIAHAKELPANDQLSHIQPLRVFAGR